MFLKKLHGQKTIKRYTRIPMRMAYSEGKKKNQVITNVENVWNYITFVHYVVKMLKWYSHSRKQYEGFLHKKLKIGLSYDPAI